MPDINLHEYAQLAGMIHESAEYFPCQDGLHVRKHVSSFVFDGAVVNFNV